MNRARKASVALAGVALLVLGVAGPAAAVYDSNTRACNLNGASVGTLYMSLSPSSGRSDETTYGGQCGTVYVQTKYYAYVGGPAYYSGWVSSPTIAQYNHANTILSQHKATYMYGSSPVTLPIN